MDTQEFEGVVSASTQDVINKQLGAGISVGNSGEQSRISFSTYVTLRMNGFGGSWKRRFDPQLREFNGITGPVPIDIINDAPKCIGPVSYERLDEAEKECDDLLKYHQNGSPGSKSCL